MKKLLILSILLSFILLTSLVFAYSPEQSVNVTNGEAPEESIDRPSGGPQPNYNFGLNLIILNPLISTGDNLKATLEIKNEGDYVPGDLEIICLVCKYTSPCIPINGTLFNRFTAIPGQGLTTKIEIETPINLDPGKYQLKADIKLENYFNKTVFNSFLVTSSIPIQQSGKFIQDNWNTILIFLIPTCVTILILTVWKYKRVFTKKL